MNVTFDPAKDAANLAKHGFSLLDAVGFEWEAAVVWLDKRHEYDEARMVGLVPVNDRLFAWCLLTGRQSNRSSAALSV